MNLTEKAMQLFNDDKLTWNQFIDTLQTLHPSNDKLVKVLGENWITGIVDENQLLTYLRLI